MKLNAMQEYRILSQSDLAISELRAATSRFGPMKSPHEGIAIIEEEFLELRSAVFWPDKAITRSQQRRRQREEAIQLAAMAIRFLVDFPDLDDDGGGA